jgi:tight adherence protein B
VAELGELSALGLRAGLPPADAAALACEVAAERAPADRPTPWAAVADAVTSARREGTSVGAALGEVARTSAVGRAAGADELVFLATAWRLSEETGAPAAPAAAGAAAVVRGRVRASDRRAALVAGPRASMTLLTALPLAGPLLAVLIGLPVTSVYGSGPVAVVAGSGLLLTGAGWWWARTMLRRALRGTPLTTPHR